MKKWTVITTAVFDDWFDKLDTQTRYKVLAGANALMIRGNLLGRPIVDTVKGSQFANMKELRIKSPPIRIFFAFDPIRQAILLCAGDKSNDKLFYKRMIVMADKQFEMHLKELNNAKNNE